MDPGLTVAGIICVAMGIGHNTIGLIWVLPNITEEQVTATPFGPRAMTLSMIRVSWFIVTIFVLSVGGVLLTLASAPADPSTVVLRWFTAMWLAAVAMATWVAARRLRAGSGPGVVRGLMRLPVPFLWVIVAVLCWRAAA